MSEDKAKIEKLLPDGTRLVAVTWDEPDYPGIRISLIDKDGRDQTLCFAEFNSTKEEGKQLSICAYCSNIDEPTYYESYSTPGHPSPNV